MAMENGDDDLLGIRGGHHLGSLWRRLEKGMILFSVFLVWLVQALVSERI